MHDDFMIFMQTLVSEMDIFIQSEFVHTFSAKNHFLEYSKNMMFYFIKNVIK